MNAELRIRTPEGITFAYPLAGPVVRFLAFGMDFLVIAALGSVVGKVARLGVLFGQDFAAAMSTLIFFAIGIGYGMFCEWRWLGQTLGKRMLRLRVMDAQGLHLQFPQIALRNLLRFVDFLPGLYLVGGVACLLSPRAQRLGDLAANTVVVYEPLLSEPDLQQLLSGKFNSLRAHPHLEARLRQRVPPDAGRLALQALLRRDEMDPPARVALFAELADFFKGLSSFPPETLEVLSDEQFVRNVVDVLFRKRTS